MSIKTKFLVAVGAFISMFCGAANADIIIDEFTGDDIQMQFVFTDVAGGVQVDVSFTAASVETGDITGVWLGYNDALFTGTLLTSDVTVVATGLDGYEVFVPAVVNLGNGVTLEGGAGIYGTFDLDIAIKQLETTGPGSDGNDIIAAYTITILHDDLDAIMFNEAGARVQSSGGNEESSKLIGGRVGVPEPGTLGLLGLGLAGLGVRGMKKKA